MLTRESDECFVDVEATAARKLRRWRKKIWTTYAGKWSCLSRKMPLCGVVWCGDVDWSVEFPSLCCVVSCCVVMSSGVEWSGVECGVWPKWKIGDVLYVRSVGDLSLLATLYVTLLYYGTTGIRCRPGICNGCTSTHISGPSSNRSLAVCLCFIYQVLDTRTTATTVWDMAILDLETAPHRTKSNTSVPVVC